MKDIPDGPDKESQIQARIQAVHEWAGSTPLTTRTPSAGAHCFYKADQERPKIHVSNIQGLNGHKLEVFGATGFIELHDPEALNHHLDLLPTFAGEESPADRIEAAANGNRNDTTAAQAWKAGATGTSTREECIAAAVAAAPDEAKKAAETAGRQYDIGAATRKRAAPAIPNAAESIRERAADTAADNAALSANAAAGNGKPLAPASTPERQYHEGDDSDELLYEQPVCAEDVGRKFAGQEGHKYRYIQDSKQWAIWVPGRSCGRWVLAASPDPLVSRMVAFGSKPGNYWRYNRKTNALDMDPHQFRASGKMHGMALQAARALKPIADELSQWDTDPATMGLPDGTMVDGREGHQVRPRRPTDKILKCAGASPRKGNDWILGPWHEEMDRAFPNSLEHEFFQTWIGRAALCGGGKDMLWSPGERHTGKTSIAETLIEVFGDYAIALDPKRLLFQDIKDHTTTSMVMKLQGMRLVSLTELPKGYEVDATTIKLLVGGDRIVARETQGKTLVFKPTHSIWVGMNGLPDFGDMEGSDWDSIIFLPMNEVVPHSKRVDGGYAQVLLKDKASVIGWVIEGARRYVEQGMPPWSERMKRAHQAISKFDPVKDFFAQYPVGTRLALPDIKDEFAARDDECRDGYDRNQGPARERPAACQVPAGSRIRGGEGHGRAHDTRDH